jgi:type II secretory pathway component GspD/PulD (secretin)
MKPSYVPVEAQHRATLPASRACWLLPLIVMPLLASTPLCAQEVRSEEVDTLPAAMVRESRNSNSDSVSVQLVDVELRVAVQALGRYLDRPVLYTATSSPRVTLETPVPVPRGEVVRLLRSLVESHSMTLSLDSTETVYRVETPEQPGNSGVAAAPLRSTSAGISLHVIQLRHARATDVAGTISALYGRAAALGEIGRREAESPVEQPMSAGGVRLPTYSGGPFAGSPQPASAEFTIVPDPNSNALLVRASDTDLRLVQDAVAALDVRPLQVLIEIVIAEVRRDRSFEFGVDLSVPPQRVEGNQDLTASASQRGIALGDFALRVLRNGPGVDFDAILRASAARGDARILSRPIILASNGELAEILVGSQRPFVQIQRSLPTDTPIRDQVVQYRDVGTRLSVRPTISSDNYVSLSITQEVNAATSETQFDAPIISTRTVQTVLLVRDSQTVVLGGLSDQQRDAAQSGVPVLSSIPLIGGLFGRARRQATETEFFLFLRPRIIRTDADAEAVTVPYQERADHHE